MRRPIRVNRRLHQWKVPSVGVETNAGKCHNAWEGVQPGPAPLMMISSAPMHERGKPQYSKHRPGYDDRNKIPVIRRYPENNVRSEVNRAKQEKNGRNY